MTQVKVIITQDKVYTTFYKTIHLRENYIGNVSNGDRYNDEASRMARALAFSLASKDSNPSCAIVDWNEKTVTDRDVFDYLNQCHPKG